MKLVLLIHHFVVPLPRWGRLIKPSPRPHPKKRFYSPLRLTIGGGLTFTFPETGEGVTAVTDEVDTKAFSTK